MSVSAVLMLVWFFLIEMEQEFSAMAKDPKCTSVEFQVGPRESALLRAMLLRE